MKIIIYCPVCKAEEELADGNAMVAKSLLADKKKDGWAGCRCNPPNKVRWGTKLVKDDAGPPPALIVKDASARGGISVSGHTGQRFTHHMPLAGSGHVSVDFVVHTGTRALHSARVVVLMAHGRQCEKEPVGGFGGGETDLNLAVAYACPPGHSLYRLAAYSQAVAAVELLVRNRPSFVTASPNALLGNHTQLELEGGEMSLLADCIKNVLAVSQDCDFAIMDGYDIRDCPLVASVAVNDGKIPFYFVGQALKSLHYDTVLLLACRSPWNGDPVIAGMLASGISYERCDVLFNPITPVLNILGGV